MTRQSDQSTGRRASVGKKLLLAAASFLITVGLLEAALWLLCPLPPVPASRVHRYLPSWTAVGGGPRVYPTDPGSLHGVTPGILQNAFNSYGFLYDEKRSQRASEEELRVVVVGGSTVECGMLRAEKRWSAVLEGLLGSKLARPVTVLNLGISAQDTRTHLATASHVVTDLDVDVCVFMIGANDLGILTSSNHPMLEHDAFYPQQRFSRALQDLLRGTQISRRLRHIRQNMGAARTGPYFAKEAAFQASLPPCVEDVVPTASGLANYARNVVSLAGICREHDIAVLFTTQPCMFPEQPTPEQMAAYWGCHTGTHRITAENFRALIDQINRELARICQQRGYPCVDLARDVPSGLGFFYDQVHFNEAGARRVAERLVEPVLALQ